MRWLLTTCLLFLLTGCAFYPAQHPGVQPEVVMHYKWWNNLVEQPVALVELRNTTSTPYENFLVHVKIYDENDKVISAFDVHKGFALPGGQKRTFRIALPVKPAAVVKVFMVGYDEDRPDHEGDVLVLESERE